MIVLLTGGAGYIGSHVAVELAMAGHEPLIVDNFSNSDMSAIHGIAKIVGWKPQFFEGDVRDGEFMFDLFRDHNIHGVIHLAGRKSVAESFRKPLTYYGNNIGSTFELLRAMGHRGVNNMVFSSSATVYGAATPVPYQEHYQRGRATSPYAATKIMNEQVLEDLAKNDHGWQFTVLRYFNPAGAHPSGVLGESPRGEPDNLFPYITQVLTGEREILTVHGQNYPTPDGTCQRDYLHVMDLARAHVQALDTAKWRTPGEVNTWNLGTGRPASVLDVIKAFEKVSRRKVRWQYGPRRAGDLATYWADPTKAKTELGWEAERTLVQMAADAWRYAQEGSTL